MFTVLNFFFFNIFMLNKRDEKNAHEGAHISVYLHNMAIRCGMMIRHWVVKSRACEGSISTL